MLQNVGEVSIFGDWSHIISFETCMPILVPEKSSYSP